MEHPLKTKPCGFEEKSSDICLTESTTESGADECLDSPELFNKIEIILKRLETQHRNDFNLYCEKNQIKPASLAPVRKFLLARLKVGIKNMLLSPTPNNEISQEVAQRVVELIWLDLAIEDLDMKN